MNGRAYDYQLGRFLSVDPFIQGTSSDAINPYSYIGNNPLSGTDPTGYIHEKEGTTEEKIDTATVKEGDKIVEDKHGNRYLDQGGDELIRIDVADNGKVAVAYDKGTATNVYDTSKLGSGKTSPPGESIIANDLKLTESQEEQLIGLKDLLGSARKENERYLTVEASGTTTEPTSSGCTNDECEVAINDDTVIVFHRHVNTNSRSRSENRKLTLTREFPGPGDHVALDHDVINAYYSPKGAIRVVERINGESKVRTIHGGNPEWNSFVSKNWKPGMSKDEMSTIIQAEGIK